MTEQEFEQLLLQSESTILDFKMQQYDFMSDTDNKKTAEFIKDIVSFANTIRSDKAFIIIGIEVKNNGQKQLHGLDKHVDDSIFQDKIKNKVLPIPHFSYSTFNYKGKEFGIIEIPVKRYEHPISPVVKLKGLEPGKFYFRRGSSNAEANGMESIGISNWLQSLPQESDTQNISVLITGIINKVTKANTKLSECISEALQLAIKYDLKDLKFFCENELSGWNKLTDEQIQSTHSFRTNEVVFVFGELQMPLYLNWDSRKMINELKKMEGVYVRQFFFGLTIMDIEDVIAKLSESNSILYSTEISAMKIIDDEKYKDSKVKVYANKDNFDNIYKNIRQKLVEQLFLVIK